MKVIRFLSPAEIIDSLPESRVTMDHRGDYPLPALEQAPGHGVSAIDCNRRHRYTDCVV
jgi:hypothetical protein